MDILVGVRLGLWYASFGDILNVYQLLTSVVSPMAEFGDLSSSVHGFLFTVTSQLPNKSLPDQKKKKKKWVPDYFIIPLPSHNSSCSSLWIISHPLSLGLKIQWKYYCVKIIFCVIGTLLKENQVTELAVSIMGHIRKTSHGHMASTLCISGTVDIPGCGHRLHWRGVGMPGPRSAGIVHRRDVRELWEPGLLGGG